MSGDATPADGLPAVARPSQIVVRERLASDSRIVRRIARETWRATYEGHVPDAFIAAILRRGYDRQRMLLNLVDPKRDALVVEADGHLVGYADLREVERREVELTRIYVRPAFQRTGCGRALLDRCLYAARGRRARRIVLDVDPTNERAIAWYERRRFRRIGEEPFTVGDITRPAIRMALDL